MSLSSMTGFARIEGQHDTWSWAWEARSVNGRGLDLRLRLPSGFEALEPLLRRAGKQFLARGNVQISLQYRRSESSAALVVHENVARALVNALQPLVDDGLATPARVDGLLSVRGVLDTPRISDDDGEMAAIRDAMAAGITPLFDALAAARRSEGAATAKVISTILADIESLLATARQCDGAQPAAILQRLRTHITAMLEDQGIEPERLAQEAALLALKADVREELDRLNAHIGAAQVLLEEDQPVGRKLEFLTQEFNREANTLCSKSSDLALTKTGLALKTKIDQMREQAANVE